MLIGYMYILCILVVIESINEGSPFLLTTSTIERWRVGSDSHSICTRIAGFEASASPFSDFTPWVPIYFAINNSHIIGILSFKVSSYYLLFYSAMLATDLFF